MAHQFDSNNNGISVIVPAYNSATILPQLVARLHSVLVTFARPFELILVNDGSRDNTWNVIQGLALERSWVRGLCMMRNYGQHNALLAGIRAARYNVTITMDDDLQHPPEELPKLIAKLDEGFDVVYGPPEQEQHGLFRDVASIVTKIALRTATHSEVAGMVCALRIFRTHLREAFSAYRSPFVSIDVLLCWGTKNFSAIRVRHEARSQDKSNYTFVMLVRHALNMMTGFSVLPLQLAGLIGFAFALFGITVLAYVLAIYIIRGTSVAGFPFLASIIAIFSGAQLFALGIIGEYLARVHFRTMDKPPYTIREGIGGVE